MSAIRPNLPNGFFFVIFSFNVSGRKAFHPFGVFDRSRGDAVDADAVAAPFDGKVSRDRVDAGLCGRNVDLHRRGEIMQRRGDIQDLARMIFSILQTPHGRR